MTFDDEERCFFRESQATAKNEAVPFPEWPVAKSFGSKRKV